MGWRVHPAANLYKSEAGPLQVGLLLDQPDELLAEL
jgi:hypothetical protein